ncbi:MAG: citrate transporter [Clostridia bacterium]|nr:citrate transporter [Clostridia bacterium]
MTKLKAFVKNETVLIISFILAAASAFIVKPNSGYIDYIDFRTLALLLCLMAVMAGLNGLGVFRLLASKMLGFATTSRSLCLWLCALCFFSSMVITNDVALITFVPFSVVALKLSNREKLLIPLITLETVAANLGSMLTPVGNPQNLYLFSAFNMTVADFFVTVLPYAVLSFILLIISSFFIKSEKLSFVSDGQNTDIDYKRCTAYGVLFAVAILTVFRVIPYEITLAVSVIAILIFDRKVLTKVDYSLLLTFVFLFIFIGNLKNIAPVSDFLSKTVSGNEVAVGIAASQVFSNVPAAILLSGFTDNIKNLLIGVNLGGLGTLIASMASLISFKLIAKEQISSGRYILVFTAVNIVFLVFNVLLWLIIR